MDVTDNEDYSDGDSAGGDVRNLSMSESHCSDFSDADNTDSHDVSDSQSTPLGSDPLAQLLATPEHTTGIPRTLISPFNSLQQFMISVVH